MSSFLPELNCISTQSQICNVAALPFDSCFSMAYHLTFSHSHGVRNMCKCAVAADDAERCRTFPYESGMRKFSLVNIKEILDTDTILKVPYYEKHVFSGLYI